MKKVTLILSLCAIIAACSNNNKSATLSADSAANADVTAKSQETNADTNVNDIGTTPAPTIPNSPGAKLIAASDCLGCHKTNEKLVGPAYADVAKKYKSTDENITMLANKVIKGGSGNWGDVPMSAHPNLSLADAKEMVTYILTVK